MYGKLDNSILIELIRLIDNIPEDIEGDVFGKIYEYFLGKFAMSEGRRGGEFFTPTSIVKLIVEIIEPYEGRIYDPACGSGGMFVQSAKFVKEHKSNPTKKISIYGQEKEEDTVKLNKMNLAVHGLAGDIRQGITYYEDLHSSINKFDYVMANPPFNVKEVDKEKIKNDARFPFGIPSLDNANYLWMQIFFSALKKNGKAGFVPLSAVSDAAYRAEKQGLHTQIPVPHPHVLLSDANLYASADSAESAYQTPYLQQVAGHFYTKNSARRA